MELLFKTALLNTVKVSQEQHNMLVKIPQNGRNGTDTIGDYS